MNKKQLKQTVIVNEKESDPGECADKKNAQPVGCASGEVLEGYRPAAIAIVSGFVCSVRLTYVLYD
jgi:hypothetical protein